MLALVLFWLLIAVAVAILPGWRHTRGWSVYPSVLTAALSILWLVLFSSGVMTIAGPLTGGAAHNGTPLFVDVQGPDPRVHLGAADVSLGRSGHLQPATVFVCTGIRSNLVGTGLATIDVTCRIRGTGVPGAGSATTPDSADGPAPDTAGPSASTTPA